MRKLFLNGRTSANRFASLVGPMLLLNGRTSASRFSSLTGPMLLLITLALAVTACGVKNDLEKPNGQTTPRGEPDPSKPPYPLGR
jgi:predicted small lipoprotein YifL